jgi:2,6-dihydroxypyridine 3-monooxygenase
MTDKEGTFRSTTMPPHAIKPEFVEAMHEIARRDLAPTFADIVCTSGEPMIQAIFDLEVPQMVFDRVCLLGDAAFGLRPHVAAGQAKACADAWALGEALADSNGDLDAALANWERRQMELGRSSVRRTKAMGASSQLEGTMVPGDPAWKFGLWEPGN